MKATFDTNILYPAVDYKALGTAIDKVIAKPKTRENALRALIATGMYTKSGKLKKQFRQCCHHRSFSATTAATPTKPPLA